MMEIEVGKYYQVEFKNNPIKEYNIKGIVLVIGELEGHKKIYKIDWLSPNPFDGRFVYRFAESDRFRRRASKSEVLMEML